MYIPPFQLGIFVGAVGVIALEITAVLIDNYRLQTIFLLSVYFAQLPLLQSILISISTALSYLQFRTSFLRC